MQNAAHVAVAVASLSQICSPRDPQTHWYHHLERKRRLPFVEDPSMDKMLCPAGAEEGCCSTVLVRLGPEIDSAVEI